MAQEWYVVQTSPQREKFATENLASYETYFPQFVAAKRIKPLFPGYIFVGATLDWSPIKNTMGVRSLLMNGEAPARLSHEVIRSWKARERGGYVQLPPPPRFKPGERLVVLRGSLRYRTVIHTGMSGRDREQVLIDMLGQMIKISILTDDLVSEAEQRTRNSLRQRRETLMRRRATSF